MMSNLYKTSSINVTSYLVYFDYEYNLECDERGYISFVFNADELGFFDTLNDFKQSVKGMRCTYVDFGRLISIQEMLKKVIRVYKNNKNRGEDNE